MGAVTALPELCGFVGRFGVGTGLRWGEIVTAQTSHFANGVLVVSQTKSGRVHRVPIAPDLAAEIRRRVGRLVPFSERGSGAVTRYVRDLSKVADFRLHRLRHTYACRWLEGGGSLESLCEVLGHRDVRTTERYGRLSESFVRADAERVWAHSLGIR